MVNEDGTIARLSDGPGFWGAVNTAIERLAETEISALFVVLLLLFMFGREGVGLYLKWRKGK